MPPAFHLMATVIGYLMTIGGNAMWIRFYKASSFLLDNPFAVLMWHLTDQTSDQALESSYGLKYYSRYFNINNPTDATQLRVENSLRIVIWPKYFILQVGINFRKLKTDG